jgi:hypothetical protein
MKERGIPNELFNKRCSKCKADLEIEEVDVDKGEATLNCSICGLTYEFRKESTIVGLRKTWKMVKAHRTGLKRVTKVPESKVP